MIASRTPDQILSIGLCTALSGLQCWFLIDNMGHGASMPAMAAVPVVTACLVALPVIAEHTLAGRKALKTLALLAAFALGVAYTLPGAVGRLSEMRDTKVAGADASNSVRDNLDAELRNARERLGDAAGEVARECKTGFGKRCNGWKRTEAERAARVTELVNEIGGLAPRKIGDSTSEEIAATAHIFGFDIEAKTIGTINALSLPLFIEVALLAFGWHGFAPTRRKRPAAAPVWEPAFTPEPPPAASAPIALPNSEEAVNRVIAALRANGGSIGSQRELLAALGQTSEGCLSGTLNALEAKGRLIRRRNGRRNRIVLAA